MFRLYKDAWKNALSYGRAFNENIYQTRYFYIQQDDQLHKYTLKTKTINTKYETKTHNNKNYIKKICKIKSSFTDAYVLPAKTDQHLLSCKSFKILSEHRRQIFHQASSKDSDDEGPTKRTRRDCPLDKGELGKATWGLLHTIGAFYPDKPTDSLKKDLCIFIESLAKIYPCEQCAKDFQEDLKMHPVNAESQNDLAQWLCAFHNRVNAKVGKPPYDCTKVNERWRDGWLDGSCD